MSRYENMTNLEQLIELEHGKVGTGTKESYISKLENVKGNIQP